MIIVSNIYAIETIFIINTLYDIDTYFTYLSNNFIKLLVKLFF